MTEILDTNVILVANGQHAGVTEACVAACAKHLQVVKTSGRVAIDAGYRMLKEYQRKTTPRVGKRAGDVFLKWLLQNHANDDGILRAQNRGSFLDLDAPTGQRKPLKRWPSSKRHALSEALAADMILSGEWCYAEL